MSSNLLVTGGASGIGRTVATFFNEKNWTVTAHYHRSERPAENLPKEIRTTQADLSTSSGCERLIESYNEQGDNLDLLVNNAALYRRTDSTEFHEGDWDEQMNLNARAPYQLSLRCARTLMDGNGAVVNLTDARCRRASFDHVPYSTSKAALEHLTRNLAETLAPEVRVNAVAPGPIDFPDDYPEERKNSIIDETLLERTGTKEEIARAVYFLGSEATYTTGTTIEVDGGQHLC